MRSRVPILIPFLILILLVTLIVAAFSQQPQHGSTELWNIQLMDAPLSKWENCKIRSIDSGNYVKFITGENQEIVIVGPGVLKLERVK